MADGDFPSQNPFGGLPFFNDMMRAMSQQGPLNWDLAQQFAQLGAVGDSPDPEPDASVRITYNSLADIADLHVQEITSLSTGPKDKHTEILTTTRARWAHRTLSDLRPLFTDLATALSNRGDTGDTPDDPMAAMMANLSNMMAPAMMEVHRPASGLSPLAIANAMASGRATMATVKPAPRSLRKRALS